MIDDFAKAYLHSDLRKIREVMLWKLDGLCEYDIRRPLTSTGTNLRGLIKHQTLSESRYFGEVFDRPFPESLARWDDLGARGPTCGRPSTRRARDHRPLVACVEHSTRRSPPSPSTPGYVPCGHART